MKKRIVRSVILFLTVMFTSLCFPLKASAEPDYTDTAYWNEKCTSGQMSDSDKTACTAYMQFLSNQSGDLSDTLKKIEAERKEMAANVQKYAAEAESWQKKANEKQVEINALNAQIYAKQAEVDAMEVKIEEKQKEIEARQGELDTIEGKLKNRMVLSQPTMRLNKFTDILMGSSTFEEFLRILSGIEAISQSDRYVFDQIIVLKAQLEEDKKEMEEIQKTLEEAVKELNEKKAVVVEAQNELLALKYKALMLEKEAQQQAAELEAKGNKVAANIKALNEQMQKISEQLDSVVSANGWTYPVPGAWKSAGTWYYWGGGVHLGYDFAAPIGTPIYAVGNGVIINRADGCPSGYLGSACGYQYGGSSGGGNQVYLLTIVNGNLYAVKYLHMLSGTPIAAGTVVTAGTKVGAVGTSGNSSGPHCHIEVFYLGDGSNFSYYAKNWNGDLAFGCGWGYAALNRRCESGVGAPCRIRPETVFGG